MYAYEYSVEDIKKNTTGAARRLLEEAEAMDVMDELLCLMCVRFEEEQPTLQDINDWLTADRILLRVIVGIDKR